MCRISNEKLAHTVLFKSWLDNYVGSKQVLLSYCRAMIYLLYIFFYYTFGKHDLNTEMIYMYFPTKQCLIDYMYILICNMVLCKISIVNIIIFHLSYATNANETNVQMICLLEISFGVNRRFLLFIYRNIVYSCNTILNGVYLSKK